MAKYHISSDGEPRPCEAAEGQCPLGGDGESNPHFSNIEEARSAYEERANREYGEVRRSERKEFAPRRVPNALPPEFFQKNSDNSEKDGE